MNKKTRNWLRAFRKNNSLTQKDMAKKMGVCQNTYSRWETLQNQKTLKQDTMEKLANILGITVTEIIHLENKHKNEK